MRVTPPNEAPGDSGGEQHNEGERNGSPHFFAGVDGTRKGDEVDGGRQEDHYDQTGRV